MTIRYETHSLGSIKNFFVSINSRTVARQSRVPPKGDYILPPAGYILWGADIGCSIPAWKHLINASLSGTNLPNTAYRDYLNQFRYFIDDLGGMLVFVWSFPLELPARSDKKRPVQF